MFFTMLQITNQLEPRLQSKTLLFKLMLLHSDPGTKPIMELRLVLRKDQRRKKEKLNINLTMLLARLLIDKKLVYQILPLMINLLVVDFQLASHQDQVKVVVVMDTSLKEKNLISTKRLLNVERDKLPNKIFNKYIVILIVSRIFYSKFYYPSIL